MFEILVCKSLRKLSTMDNQTTVNGILGFNIYSSPNKDLTNLMSYSSLKKHLFQMYCTS